MTTSLSIDVAPDRARDAAVADAQQLVPMCWTMAPAAVARCRSRQVGGWQELQDIAAPAASSDIPSTAGPPPVPIMAPSLRFDEAEMARACAAAASSARAEEMLSVSLADDRHRLRLLGEIVGAVRGLDERMQADAASARREFAHVARAVAAALTFRNDADRLAELEATVDAMIRAAPRDAALILELAPDNLEQVRAQLNDLPIRLVAVATLGPFDVRLSWRDGWLEHLRAVLEAGIDEALACAAVSGSEPDLEP